MLYPKTNPILTPNVVDRILTNAPTLTRELVEGFVREFLGDDAVLHAVAFHANTFWARVECWDCEAREHGRRWLWGTNDKVEWEFAWLGAEQAREAAQAEKPTEIQMQFSIEVRR